jgi:hypothetical protein
MSLLSRLLGENAGGEDKIAVHQFMAALAEYDRGAVTGVQIKNVLGLTPAEATNLQEFLDGLDSAGINRDLVHDVLLLGEEGSYSKATVKSRLGLTAD